MKRTLSFSDRRSWILVVAGTGLIAVTYGLVRLAFGLFLPDVQTDLGLRTTSAGYLSAATSVSYCLGAAAGFVASTDHPRRLAIAAGTCATAGAGGMALAPDVPVLAVAAVVGSAGAGLASPAMVGIVARNGREDSRDRRQAVVNSGTGPGLVAAGVLALAVLPHWRWAWAAAAVLAVLTTVAVVALDRGPGPRPRRGDVPARPTRRWWRAHLVPVAAAFLLGVGSAAVWNYGRSALVEAGATERTSVVAWVALGVGGTAVAVTSRAVGRLDTRLAWSLTTLVAAAATATLAVAAESGFAALLACGAFGWGFVAATGALIAWTTEIDGVQASAGTSMLFVLLVLGQAAGAPVVGVLVSTAGHGLAFGVAAGATAAAALVPALGRAVDLSRPSPGAPGRPGRRATVSCE